MKELGILSIVVKKFWYHCEKITPEERENLFNQDFMTAAIYQSDV